MKPIQRHPLEIKAILDGASAMLFVIEHPCKTYSSRGRQEIRIEPENDPWYKDRNYCIRDEYGGWQDLTKDEFLNYTNSPLQVGDTFYVQEDYSFVRGKIKYKLSSNQKHLMDMGMSNHDAPEMTSEQSRIKGTVTSIEAKRVQELKYNELIHLFGGKLPYPQTLENFVESFDSIHREGTYESNPYVFIVGVE